VLTRALFTLPEDMAHGTPGTRLHGNPMYLGRLADPYHISLITTVIGAAKASLDEYEAIIRAKKTTFPPIIPRFEHEDFQRALGQGMVLTDAAEQLMIRGCEIYMELCERWAADGTLIAVEENLRLWTLMQQSGRMACDAVELLFKNAGTSVTRKGSRMERYLRAVRELLGAGGPCPPRPAHPAFRFLIHQEAKAVPRASAAPA
jgi:3-hydroxy-9,10-secoandrosta-1,3,5(10)-triene-9,17-dione monooxygenase